MARGMLNIDLGLDDEDVSPAPRGGRRASGRNQPQEESVADLLRGSRDMGARLGGGPRRSAARGSAGGMSFSGGDPLESLMQGSRGGPPPQDEDDDAEFQRQMAEAMGGLSLDGMEGAEALGLAAGGLGGGSSARPGRTPQSRTPAGDRRSAAGGSDSNRSLDDIDDIMGDIMDDRPKPKAKPKQRATPSRTPPADDFDALLDQVDPEPEDPFSRPSSRATSRRGEDPSGYGGPGAADASPRRPPRPGRDASPGPAEAGRSVSPMVRQRGGPPSTMGASEREGSFAPSDRSGGYDAPMSSGGFDAMHEEPEPMIGRRGAGRRKLAPKPQEDDDPLAEMLGLGGSGSASASASGPGPRGGRRSSLAGDGMGFADDFGAGPQADMGRPSSQEPGAGMDLGGGAAGVEVELNVGPKPKRRLGAKAKAKAQPAPSPDPGLPAFQDELPARGRTPLPDEDFGRGPPSGRGTPSPRSGGGGAPPREPSRQASPGLPSEEEEDLDGLLMDNSAPPAAAASRAASRSTTPRAPPPAAEEDSDGALPDFLRQPREPRARRGAASGGSSPGAATPAAATPRGAGTTPRAAAKAVPQAALDLGLSAEDLLGTDKSASEMEGPPLPGADASGSLSGGGMVEVPLVAPKKQARRLGAAKAKAKAEPTAPPQPAAGKAPSPVASAGQASGGPAASSHHSESYTPPSGAPTYSHSGTGTPSAAAADAAAAAASAAHSPARSAAPGATPSPGGATPVQGGGMPPGFQASPPQSLHGGVPSLHQSPQHSPPHSAQPSVQHGAGTASAPPFSAEQSPLHSAQMSAHSPLHSAQQSAQQSAPHSVVHPSYPHTAAHSPLQSPFHQSSPPLGSGPHSSPCSMPPSQPSHSAPHSLPRHSAPPSAAHSVPQSEAHFSVPPGSAGHGPGSGVPDGASGGFVGYPQASATPQGSLASGPGAHVTFHGGHQEVVHQQMMGAPRSPQFAAGVQVPAFEDAVSQRSGLSGLPGIPGGIPPAGPCSVASGYTGSASGLQVPSYQGLTPQAGMGMPLGLPPGSPLTGTRSDGGSLYAHSQHQGLDPATAALDPAHAHAAQAAAAAAAAHAADAAAAQTPHRSDAGKGSAFGGAGTPASEAPLLSLLGSAPGDFGPRGAHGGFGAPPLAGAALAEDTFQQLALCRAKVIQLERELEDCDLRWQTRLADQKQKADAEHENMEYKCRRLEADLATAKEIHEAETRQLNESKRMMQQSFETEKENVRRGERRGLQLDLEKVRQDHTRELEELRRKHERALALAQQQAEVEAEILRKEHSGEQILSKIAEQVQGQVQDLHRMSQRIDADKSLEYNMRERKIEEGEKRVREAEARLSAQTKEVEEQRTRVSELVRRMEDSQADDRSILTSERERLELEHKRLLELQKSVREADRNNKEALKHAWSQLEDEKRCFQQDQLRIEGELNARREEVELQERQLRGEAERLKVLHQQIEVARQNASRRIRETEATVANERRCLMNEMEVYEEKRRLFVADVEKLEGERKSLQEDRDAFQQEVQSVGLMAADVHNRTKELKGLHDQAAEVRSEIQQLRGQLSEERSAQGNELEKLKTMQTLIEQQRLQLLTTENQLRVRGIEDIDLMMTTQASFPMDGDPSLIGTGGTWGAFGAQQLPAPQCGLAQEAAGAEAAPLLPLGTSPMPCHPAAAADGAMVSAEPLGAPPMLDVQALLSQAGGATAPAAARPAPQSELQPLGRAGPCDGSYATGPSVCAAAGAPGRAAPPSGRWQPATPCRAASGAGAGCGSRLQLQTLLRRTREASGEMNIYIQEQYRFLRQESVAGLPQRDSRPGAYEGGSVSGASTPTLGGGPGPGSMPSAGFGAPWPGGGPGPGSMPSAGFGAPWPSAAGAGFPRAVATPGGGRLGVGNLPGPRPASWSPATLGRFLNGEGAAPLALGAGPMGPPTLSSTSDETPGGGTPTPLEVLRPLSSDTSISA